MLRVGTAMGLIINASYDASISNSADAAAIESAVASAVQFFEQQIGSNITVNIAFGSGELGNGAYPLDSSTLAEAVSRGGNTMSFAALKAALANSATSADDRKAIASLGSDPTNGGDFYVPAAEQKALGLVSATSTAIDGYVGISDQANFA